MSFPELLQAAAVEYGLALTPAQIAAYDRYQSLLVTWNAKVNLTAITDPAEIAVKHIVDSLSCYDAQIFRPGARLVDVGTGAGFPGLPLKIYRPELALTLMDSLNKRLLFLQEVLDQLGLGGVELVHARAEDAGRQRQHRERYDIAVSRAVARLNVLCELCLPLVGVGGWFVALKGAQFQEEIAESSRAIKLLGGELSEVRPVTLPGLSDVRSVVMIRKRQPSPPAYPRKAGTPEKKPL